MKTVNRRLNAMVVLVSLLLTVLGLIELSGLAQFGYRLSYEQGVAFWRKHFAVAAALASGAVLSIVGLSLCKRATAGPLIKYSAIVSLCLSLAGLAVWGISPGKMGAHSIQSSANKCQNNIRKIETAKGKWAGRTGATNGATVTWEAIATNFPNGLPVCPDGGKYKLGGIGEPAQCSVPAHQIPD